MRQLIEELNAEVRPAGIGTLIEERTSHHWGGVPRDEVVGWARRRGTRHSRLRTSEQAERGMREARQAGGRRSGFRRLVSRGCVAADRETGVEALFLEENISKDNTGERQASRADALSKSQTQTETYITTCNST